MTDNTLHPDSEPEFGKPVFRSDDPVPPQAGPDLSSNPEQAPSAQTRPGSPEDASRPDAEPAFGEPVFRPDEPLPDQTEPVFSTAPEAETTVNPEPPPTGAEPTFPQEARPLPAVDAEPDPGPDGPVFAMDREPADSTSSEQYQESPALETVSTEEPESGPVPEGIEERVAAPSQPPPEATGRVNVAADAEPALDPVSEREYALFDETPAADVAMTPPPRRRLGRTGPVWVIGGIALVVIVGVVWLAVSRLAGLSDDPSQALAEPTVQQLEAPTATAAPPTATAGPSPTPAPVRLPIGANVIVGDTEGQGVMLRANPGVFGEVVDIIGEGTKVVVMEAEPVEADGYLWYRMRVPDGVDENGDPLVGWSASDFFVVESQ